MLFTRYANPLPLLNNMIRTSRLTEFLGEIAGFRKEETEDKMLFDVWLHRRKNTSYSDFLDEVERNRLAAETPSRKSLENAVQTSFETLQAFSIEEERR